MNSRHLLDVEELDLLRFSFELVALPFARLVAEDVGLRRLPVDAPKAREGVVRGAEDLVSGESVASDNLVCNQTCGLFV